MAAKVTNEALAAKIDALTEHVNEVKALAKETNGRLRTAELEVATLKAKAESAAVVVPKVGDSVSARDLVFGISALGSIVAMVLGLLIKGIPIIGPIVAKAVKP